LVFAHQKNGFVVVVIIGVFLVINQICIGKNRFKKIFEIIVFRDEQFGYITAAQSIISENIFAKSFEFFTAFTPVQYSNGISVLPDNVGIFSEIIIKIPGCVIASGSDNCIEISKLLFGYFYSSGKFRFNFFQVFQQKRNHFLVV